MKLAGKYRFIPISIKWRLEDVEQTLQRLPALERAWFELFLVQYYLNEQLSDDLPRTKHVTDRDIVTATPAAVTAALRPLERRRSNYTPSDYATDILLNPEEALVCALSPIRRASRRLK